MEWYFKCMQLYTELKGRARRREYWTFMIYNLVFYIIACFIDGIAKISLFSSAYALVVLIPSIAVSVRRLHDLGKSGWMLLLNFIPVIGQIWLILLFLTDSQHGSNKWGENPKGE